MSVKAIVSQVVMRVVAKRLCRRSLAAAQIVRTRSFSAKNHRVDACSLMRAVAVGLVLRVAAPAPRIIFTGFQFDFIRSFLGDDAILWHGYLSAVVIGHLLRTVPVSGDGQ